MLQSERGCLAACQAAKAKEKAKAKKEKEASKKEKEIAKKEKAAVKEPAKKKAKKETPAKKEKAAAKKDDSSTKKKAKPASKKVLAGPSPWILSSSRSLVAVQDHSSPTLKLDRQVATFTRRRNAWACRCQREEGA